MIWTVKVQVKVVYLTGIFAGKILFLFSVFTFGQVGGRAGYLSKIHWVIALLVVVGPLRWDVNLF